MILLGINAYAARGDDARRTDAALRAMRALEGVRLANVQWPDDGVEVEGFRTLPVLRRDARTVSGRQGRRLPIVREVLDALAAAAPGEGCRWIAFANADVRPTQAAIDLVRASDLDAHAFSRADEDPETGARTMVTAGVDLFAVEVGWWRRNAHRLRDYPAGEPVWDNVLAALLLWHGRAVLHNRHPLVLHEAHPAGDWRASPYAAWVRYLAALDRDAFTRWAHYHAGLLELRERDASEAAELALQRRIFGRPPTLGERIVQALRTAKAMALYRPRRRG